MIVQNNVTSQISRAVRMPGRFMVNGVWFSGGHVLIFESATSRKVVAPEDFDQLYTELPYELAPPYPVAEEGAFA